MAAGASAPNNANDDNKIVPNEGSMDHYNPGELVSNIYIRVSSRDAVAQVPPGSFPLRRTFGCCCRRERRAAADRRRPGG